MQRVMQCRTGAHAEEFSGLGDFRGEMKSQPVDQLDLAGGVRARAPATSTPATKSSPMNLVQRAATVPGQIWIQIQP